MTKPFSRYVKGWDMMANKRRAIKINLYTDKLGKMRWRCIAANGRQIAKCPCGYGSMSMLLDDLAFIVARAHDAELYKDKSDQWRWRFRNEDGRIIASSGESYYNRIDCLAGSDLFLDAEVISDGN